MEQSLSSARRFTQVRKSFYLELLEFTRQNPKMKVSLHVPRRDLPLLAADECSSIVDDLLNLCESGRLTLTGAVPTEDLPALLHSLGKGASRSGRSAADG